MLIFVQVCRTIDKNFSVFNSSIGYEDQMKSIGIYKKEAWRHLKKRGFKDKSFWRSEAEVIRSILIRSCSPEADVIRGSEDHQKLEDWKLQD